VSVEEGIKDMPLITPPVQLYEFAPVPLRTTDTPEQTVDDGEMVTPTTGNGFTVIVIGWELVQPLAPVPVTV
jgi:hypothetical protein